MIRKVEFQNTIGKMLQLAATKLPQDVVEALKGAKEREEKSTAKGQLKTILKNLEIAKEKNAPLCQDTGLPIFFTKIGRETNLGFDLKEALEESVQKATESVPLRPNVVDPLSRENSGNNTGENQPSAHFSIVPGKSFEIKLMLKGAGSENWSRLFMLKPSESEEVIKDKILHVIQKAGGQVCPPSIVGVGIGGTAEQAGLLAKKALLRPLDDENESKEISDFEKEITRSANETGIGPMGLGGKTTVLGTKIEKAGSHTASLPVAVNFQCWAARRAKAGLKGEKLRIEVPE